MISCMCYMYKKSFKFTSIIDYPIRKFLRAILSISDLCTP